MKAKSLLIWIILLNIFDCSVCLTSVWLRKLLLNPNSSFSCSPHAVWKVRLTFQQFLNSSDSHGYIWRKAEAKFCSSQSVTFDILLTTKNCSLRSSSQMKLSLYLLEKQSVGFDFYLPITCSALNTTLIIDQEIEHNGSRLLVGYINEWRKSRYNVLNATTSQTVSTDAILLNESGLFQPLLWLSKRRGAEDVSLEENDLRKQTVLRRDSNLSLESFKESKQKLGLMQFGSLQEATKLERKALHAAYSAETEKTKGTEGKTVTADSRDVYEENTKSRIHNLSKTTKYIHKNKSEHLNNKLSTPHRKIISSPTFNQQFSINTKYISSTPFSLSLPNSKDDKIIIISSTTATQDSIKNTTADLSVTRSPNHGTLSPKETSLPNTKPTSSHQTVSSRITAIKTSTTASLSTSGEPELNTKPASSHQTVSSTITAIKTSTTASLSTSGEPELSPLSMTSTQTHIMATYPMPKDSQNPTDSHKTTEGKDITSTLRNSAANTIILSTNPIDIESTRSSLKRSTVEVETNLPKQWTTQETFHTSNHNGRDDHVSTITTSPLQTSTTTKVTMSPTLPLLLSSTSELPSLTSKTTTVTTSQSIRSLTSVITSDATKFRENATVSNSSTLANTSTNPTSAVETTFLSRSTDKNLLEDEGEDPYFWPVVLSLVIGIPAIIVFSIAMVVIMKKRDIDSSTFFMGSAIGDEEV